MSNKSPTLRKPLIETGSILENVIERDREKNGRAAPSQPDTEAGELGESGASVSPTARPNAPLTETGPPASNDLLNDLSTQVSKGLSKQVSKSAPKASSTHSVPQGSTQSLPAPAFAAKRSAGERGAGERGAGAIAAEGQSARRRLLDHAEKEAVTRLSIDVPQSMYSRIKQYVAVHNVESIRALTLALYADFLEEEGF